MRGFWLYSGLSSSFLYPEVGAETVEVGVRSSQHKVARHFSGLAKLATKETDDLHCTMKHERNE